MILSRSLFNSDLISGLPRLQYTVELVRTRDMTFETFYMFWPIPKVLTKKKIMNYYKNKFPWY